MLYPEIISHIQGYRHKLWNQESAYVFVWSNFEYELFAL